MDVDVLVIVEAVGPGRQGLFLNPVGAGGEVMIRSDLPEGWLHVGDVQVALDPASPARVRMPVGRHSLAIGQAGKAEQKIFVHCDPDGDDSVELRAYEEKGRVRVKLVARPNKRGLIRPGRLCLGFQTQPQGLEAHLHLGRSGGPTERLALPRQRPFVFRELELEDGSNLIEVRLEAPAGAPPRPSDDPYQTGGTDQVDILVEWPFGA